MKFKMLDPDQIITVVVSLIVLGVGIFAFFITMENIPVTEPSYNVSGVANTTALQNKTYYAVMNASDTGDSVFNIVGVVLIIGAIMTIVGIVVSYIRPKY